MSKLLYDFIRHGKHGQQFFELLLGQTAIILLNLNPLAQILHTLRYLLVRLIKIKVDSQESPNDNVFCAHGSIIFKEGVDNDEVFSV